MVVKESPDDGFGPANKQVATKSFPSWPGKDLNEFVFGESEEVMMMPVILRSVLRACLFLFLFPALGHAAELLRTVDKGVIDSFMAPDKYKLQYGLRWQLYKAKKYRIVEIDFDLLKQTDSEFTITPWEGLVLNVKTLETSGPGSYVGLQVWSGELMNSGGIVSGSNQLPPVNFMLRNLDQMVPMKRVRRMQAEKSRKPLSGIVSSNRSGGYVLSDSTQMMMRFQTITGKVYVPTLGSYINIEPIEDDPRYHLVFEGDPSKIAIGGEFAVPEEAEKAKKAQEVYRKIAEERVRDIGQ